MTESELIRQYLDLLAECRKDAGMAYHLTDLLRLGQPLPATAEKGGTCR